MSLRILLLLCCVPLAACGYKGKLKTPDQIERQKEKAAHEAEKQKHDEQKQQRDGQPDDDDTQATP